MKKDMKRIILPLLIFTSIGCKNVITYNELHFIDGLAYTKDKNNLFTGVAYEEFSNGNKSSEFTYSNGILLGEWKIYDHTGDIVQQGHYINDKSITKYLTKKIQVSDNDILICQFREGDILFLDITIKSKEIAKDFAFSLAEEIRSSLLKKYIVNKKRIIFQVNEKNNFIF